MAVGFFIVENISCPPLPGESGGFSSEEIQERLLEYFSAGENIVDPYDGGVFSGQLLEDLRGNLEKALLMLSKMGSNWDFSDAELVNYYRRGKIYGINLLPPKEQAEADLSRVVYFIEMANRRNATLVFIGD